MYVKLCDTKKTYAVEYAGKLYSVSETYNENIGFTGVEVECLKGKMTLSEMVEVLVYFNNEKEE
jgi:hypothetical protein